MAKANFAGTAVVLDFAARRNARRASSGALQAPLIDQSPIAPDQMSRGFLHAGIRDDGSCSYHVSEVDVRDIPAMLMMMQILSMKLTKRLDEAH